MKRTAAAVISIVTACALMAACGGGHKKRPLSVSGDSSLTEAFIDSVSPLAAQDQVLNPTFNFAGSHAIVDQLKGSASADVVALASPQTMQSLVDAKLVEPPRLMAKNVLQIAVAPGNPKGIRSLSDLEKRSVKMALVDKADPAGAYTVALFKKFKLPLPHAVSTEPDVKAALAKLLSGEVDATLVYLTDVKAAGTQVQGVDIPLNKTVIAEYQIAVLNNAKHKEAAEDFVESSITGAVQIVLRGRGFVGPG